MHRGRGRGGPSRGGPRASGSSFRPPPSETPPGGSNATMVTTNLFPITKLPNKKYWQYELTITPEVKNFARRQEIMARLKTNVAPDLFQSLPIYDGMKQVYVCSELKLHGSGGGKYLVSMNNSPPQVGQRGTYEVRLTKTSAVPVNFSDLPRLLKTRGSSVEAITVATNLLQLIIKQASNQNHPHNARSYFTDQGKMIVQGSGLELLRGFFQSVRPGINQMYINVDTSMTAAYRPGNLVDLCMDFMNTGNARDLALPAGSRGFKKLENFVKKIQVYVSSMKRVKVIRGLEPNADGFQFNKDGVAMTVGTYMKSVHNIDLRYRGIVGAKLSGPNETPIIVPLEVCMVQLGQLYKKRFPEEFTSAAVGFATLKPQERLDWISARGLAPVGDYARSEYITESGMEIATQPKTIQGKVLDIPSVMFKGELKPQNGAWNVLHQHLNEAAPFTTWAAVTFADRVHRAALESHMKSLAECCSNLGMKVGPPVKILEGGGQYPERALKEIIDEAARLGLPKNLFIVLIVLPTNAADLRTQVKHWGDIENGVRTQCIRESKLFKANNQYWNNIALKLNARLGGRNFVVKSPAMARFRCEPTIIMGADVGHPGPGIQRPSVASLVWSTDLDASKYCAVTSIQHPRLERIADLEGMAEIAIKDFASRFGGTPPSRILFFRDGLSEGEYKKTAQEEIQMLENIWKVKHSNKFPKPPKLTYVIVGKGHHLVFFPGSRNAANDGKGNCRAGFVTDQNTEIASALAPDFYLMSHQAILGTSRSSHYILLRDDNNEGIAGIQQLAFSLCHVYAKATRSVSIPAPVYYADLACSRAGFHFSPRSQHHFSDTSSVSSGGGGRQFDLEQWTQEYRPINHSMQTSMYFL
ncbi:argonaute-like protein [Moniliophthora roreri MCA 2997]|uniref:Argonaute-like protein n=1 Tax=Moniliophthora roreri (strain MCA 2997) TaxID=1381753 RepID=V2YMG7_MONRO|nr:argonaute-like protein [Moniliophthora roreri MCA 2997]